MKVAVLTARRAALNLSAPDFSEPPQVLATVELPTPFQPNKQEFQKQVVHRLERVRLAPGGGRRATCPTRTRGVASRRGRSRPDRSAQAAAQAERVANEIDELRRSVKGRGQSIARRFDRCCGSSTGGDTWTAGRSPTTARRSPGSSTRAIAGGREPAAGPARRPRPEQPGGTGLGLRVRNTAAAMPRPPRGSRRRRSRSAGRRSQRSACNCRVRRPRPGCRRTGPGPDLRGDRLRLGGGRGLRPRSWRTRS